MFIAMDKDQSGPVKEVPPTTAGPFIVGLSQSSV